MTELVWYAAYGSNMSRERLLDYVTGRQPVGAARRCRGCRDTQPPRGDRPFTLEGTLSFGGFGGPSTNWNGGVAFYAAAAVAEPTLARLWLVSLEQFEDIVAQENVREPGSIALDPTLDRQDVANGWYGQVVRVAEVEGHSVMTFTGARVPELFAPSRDYLRHIAAGLREGHDLDAAGIAAYLSTKPGVAGNLTSDELLRILAP
ncbi:MAG: histone deacetylase [Candidatus Binatia bacterium]